MVQYDLTGENTPLENYPLLLHACQHWWYHARRITPDSCLGIIHPSLSKISPLHGRFYSLSASFAAHFGSIARSTNTWGLNTIPCRLNLELALRNLLIGTESIDNLPEYRHEFEGVTKHQIAGTLGIGV